MGWSILVGADGRGTCLRILLIWEILNKEGCGTRRTWAAKHGVTLLNRSTGQTPTRTLFANHTEARPRSFLGLRATQYSLAEIQ